MVPATLQETVAVLRERISITMAMRNVEGQCSHLLAVAIGLEQLG